MKKLSGRMVSASSLIMCVVLYVPTYSTDAEQDSAKPTPIAVHRVFVDRNQPLAQMIDSCQFSWLSQYFNKQNFPSQLMASDTIDIHLFHYGRYISSYAVLVDLERRRFRPADLEELLALNLHLRRFNIYNEKPMTSLGSVWQQPVTKELICLVISRRIPELKGRSLLWTGILDEVWPKYFSFAAVPVTPSRQNK